MVVLIILPCAAICIYRIIYMVMDEKKKKENINNFENDKEMNRRYEE